MQKQKDVVSRLALYIDQNSARNISLDELSEYAHTSKFHLNRIFHAATGCKLGEYIQRRKMEKALKLLSDENLSVIDVALSIGYESHSSFSRAFKNTFGFAPNEALGGDKKNTTPQRIKKPIATSIQVAWIEREETLIKGLSAKGFDEGTFFAAVAPLYEKLTSLLKDTKALDAKDALAVGVSLGNPWATDHKEARFFAGFTHGLNNTLETLESYTWEAGHWIKVIHKGSYSKIWQTVSKVISEWVIPNDIALASRDIVQVYLNNPKTTPENAVITELYFPLLTNSNAETEPNAHLSRSALSAQR